LREDAERIRAGRQTLIKSAYVKHVLDQQSDSTKKEIRELFSAASKAPDGSSIIRDRRQPSRRPDAVVETESTPGPATAESPRPTSAAQADARRPTNDAVDKVERWTAVTFEDTQRVVAEASRVDAAVESAQMTLEDAIRTIIRAQLPTAMDPLVSLFVQSLLGSGVKTFAGRLRWRTRSARLLTR